MSQRIPARGATETTIERIFEKVVRRKMTSEERTALHLNAGGEIPFVKPSNGAGLHHKNGAKATAP